MYQVNALSDNISPALALLAEKHLGFAVPTTDFIHIKETQQESYLGVLIDNKLSFNQHIDDMSKKATNLLNLCHRNLHMCSKEVKNSAYDMIVHPHLQYASTWWNPYTKRNIDKLEAVQRRAARFVLNFYNCRPTADLSGKIKKSLQWDSLQHRWPVSDLCMFYELRNNLANIAIAPILVPSVKLSIGPGCIGHYLAWNYVDCGTYSAGQVNSFETYDPHASTSSCWPRD